MADLPALPNICDAPIIGNHPACIVGGAAREAAGAVVTAVDFASDPLGYIAQRTQEAAAGLSSTVLPELERASRPDLSQDWFASAYRVSFALAMFVFVAFLGWNFVQLARRRVSGDEVVETMAVYTPLFLGGTIFGPLAGTGLMALAGALTDALIAWGVAGSVEATSQALQDAIAAGDQSQMVGGAIVAIIVFGALIVALFFAFVALLVMLVTLYLTGAIIPLSLVWLVHPRQRAKGLKVVMVWIGICFSHVLLFLLLGIAFRMIGGMATNFAQPGTTVLANLAVAVIALLMATLSPLALLKFAPVGASTAPRAGPGIGVPGRGGVGGGYAESAGDSQTAQLARDTQSSTRGGEPPGAAPAGGDSGGGSGRQLGLLTAGRGDGQSSSSMEPAGTTGAQASGGAAGSGGSAGSGVSAGSSSGASTPGVAPSGPDTSLEPASSGTPRVDGVTTLTSAGDGMKDTGGALGSAGAAATATGMGAPIGLALQATGEVVKAAGEVVGATAEMAQAAGDMAAEQMEHGESGTEKAARDDRPPRR